jgi:DNA (cytosine-5)-methyltransferase 1
VPRLTFIDLFCGCGGFSLGLERADFKCLAALDADEAAIETFRTNLPGVPHVLQKDLTKFSPQDLAQFLGNTQPDLIAGGPPCQGFSTARQRDGANHGTRRLIADDRRQLYKRFLAYVDHFRPRVFVMENVLGLKSAAGGEYFTRVQHEARLLGYRITSQIADAFDLGVPQKRRRQFIVGVRGDLPGFFPDSLAPAKRAVAGLTVGAAIGDLPRVAAGHGSDERAYNLKQRKAHLKRWGNAAKKYLREVLEVSKAAKLTGHRARPHSARDLRDFQRLREGENSATAIRRRAVDFEFPYSKENFKDRYTRQSRWKPCSTIVAHLSKDGLMFIHPTQTRSFTPREAARIQSFPDWFQFPPVQTQQFRLIGNAVPPLVGEAVGIEVKSFLKAAGKRQRGGHKRSKPDQNPRESIPKSQRAAAAWLQELSAMDRWQLRHCEQLQFLCGWYSLFYLFPNLHPLNALDHGDADAVWSPDQVPLPGFESFAAARFERSGWPVALELLGREAWRRYKNGELTQKEFYCVDAQWLGLVAARKSAGEIRGIRRRVAGRRSSVRH